MTDIAFPIDCACQQAGQVRECCAAGIGGVLGPDGAYVYPPLPCSLSADRLLAGPVGRPPKNGPRHGHWQGRKCAGRKCGAPITDKNLTGYCYKCWCARTDLMNQRPKRGKGKQKELRV